MNRFVLALATLLFTSIWAVSFADLHVDQVSPQDIIMQASERMLESMNKARKTDSLTTKRIYELVEEIVLPHFDFDRMSRLVLGKNWRRATKEQKKEFVAEFRILLMRTYGTAMEDYTDGDIIYLPLKKNPQATEVVVKTEVDQDSGFPIPIDYRLYKKDGLWKVYDVSIDDVSLVLNYRTSFSTTIRKKDGVQGLINKLRSRNQDAMDE